MKRLLPDDSNRGPCGKALSLNLNFSFLNRISLLLIRKQLPNCPPEAGWTPFQTLYGTSRKISEYVAGNQTRDLLDGSQTSTKRHGKKLIKLIP